MTYNSEIQAEAAMAAAHEEQERAERLDSQGLCRDCGEVPRNPFVRGPVCLDCYHSNDQVGCAKIDCPNPHYGLFQGAAYCKAHFADIVHSSYHKYTKKKEALELNKRRFDKEVEQVGRHPRDYETSYDKLTDLEKQLYDKWVNIQNQARSVNFIKKEIKKAMNQGVELFPENYEVFE